MKVKILSILLALSMALTMLAACNNEQPVDTPNNPDEQIQEDEQNVKNENQEPETEEIVTLDAVSDGVQTFVPVLIGANGFAEDYPKVIEALKEAGVSRVFLCGFSASYDSDEYHLNSAENFGKYAKIFEEAGFEVAAWINGFGHGGSVVKKTDTEYTLIEDRSGKVNSDGYCPLDENYIAQFQEYVQLLVKNGAKMIMMDDDYRMLVRDGGPYCFCEKHLALMSEYLGREVTKRDFSFIFSIGENGGPSEERDAYMYAQGEGLKRMAQALRDAVDEIDPTVRLGHCAVVTTWDVEGVDCITLAKILAGNTKPFLRLHGAAYWANSDVFGCKNLSAIIQYERLQAYWCSDEDIEIFAEGDVYPRPRYVVPSSYLELLDLAIRASGGFDGNLKYMINYASKFDYDTGYLAHHNKNAENRTWIEEHFDGKETLGLKLFEPMNTIQYSEQTYDLEERSIPSSLKFSAYNAVPSKFDGEGLTVIWGDSAWLATEEELKNGAILDGVAADILTRRGFDVGVVEFGSKYQVYSETYLGTINDYVGIDSSFAYDMKIADSAEVLSVLNGGNVGSYTYENGNGQKFLVYAFDGRSISENIEPKEFSGITGNYRKQQLFETLEKFGESMPVCKTDAPYLYMIAKADENELSVFLMNAYEDSVLSPEVFVGSEYTRVESCNCTAEIIDGNVVLSDISAYDFAAFTVYKD